MRRPEDAPRLTADDICMEIRKTCGHQEFLFYRKSAGDDLAWILGAGEDGYEMFCTCCGRHFFEPRQKKQPAKKYEICPQCGMPVTPCRWRDRGRLESVQFSFHMFQRGEGQDVWFRSFQVSMRRDFENGEKYDIFEYMRICFQAGQVQKWTRSRDYFHGVHPWKEIRRICMKKWHGAYGQTREAVFAGVTAEDMAGSCLQYAQAQEAFDTLTDPIAYLALYCRHPVCEYIWKMGLGTVFRDRETGRGAYFAKVVNLRAKSAKRLFPELDKGDLRAMRKRGSVHVDEIFAYRRLKKEGAAANREKGLERAIAINSWYRNFWELPARCGTDVKGLLQYCDRQRGRSGMKLTGVWNELYDYLGQLDRLGVFGGDRMPQDLQAAHARLSARERKMQNRKNNTSFRLRRRLLRWMCWKRGGLFIRPVDSVEEITREGEMQDNCVAGYADNHAKGRTIILLLRRKESPRTSWHTVEIDPGTLRCRQCYQAGNKDASEEAQAFMKEYLQYLQAAVPRNNKRRKNG